MNMPASLRSVSLNDKFRADETAIFLNGSQAIVRMLLMRAEMDRTNGLNTAGFVSGYRGSPLGGLDLLLWRHADLLNEQRIVFRPGVNEDLAATAVMGSQQVPEMPGAVYDGVFAVWYGKSPGVDRSGDVFKHANNYGVAPHGGVLALLGDDHAAKSSTLPNQSEFAMIDAEMPVLYPATVSELIDMGLLGIELSRFSGLWVGMKLVSDVVDSTETVFLDPARWALAPPEITLPPHGIHARFEKRAFDQEMRLRRYRLPASLAFARANRLNRVVIEDERPLIGIMAAGRAYELVRQALAIMGMDGGGAGLRVYKVGMVWPLEPEGARDFARGLACVLVVEERRAVLESQLRNIAYELPDGVRPRIFGKEGPDGGPLLSDLAELSVREIIYALVAILPEEMQTPSVARALAQNHEIERALAKTPAPHRRDPFFCSGCPHNRSTGLPEGSQAIAGIGCHFLARGARGTLNAYSHMGGEGVFRVGQAPFIEDGHIFANLGDGTYFHSGSMAIRQAVISDVTMTFKILFNDAVAMTGGQPVEGRPTVPAMARQLLAENVARIIVVSEQTAATISYKDKLPPGVALYPRDALARAQIELRETKGVSILIYDQVCATEKRRRRKRGTIAEAPRRVFINEEVCEGCGDCSRASNCIAVEPMETGFGRKRRIDQSACNQDLTCVDGFCPSFVSLAGAHPRTVSELDMAILEKSPLPEAKEMELGPQEWNCFIAGLGGQGVVALAAIMGMAAHIERRQVRITDQHGLAQKGGGVYSHIRLSTGEKPLHGLRIAPGQADLILVGDMMAGSADEALILTSPQHTVAIVNEDLTSSAEFVQNNATEFRKADMLARIRKSCRQMEHVPARRIVTAFAGNSIHLNLFLLGYAIQKGLAPFTAGALEQAIALNGVEVDMNLHAFRLGRRMACNPDEAMRPIAGWFDRARSIPEDFAGIVAMREAELAWYQNRAYARNYRAFVEWVHARLEERLTHARADALARAIAYNLYLLMAYKDEYEVARLYTDGRFRAELNRNFESGYRVSFHFAPPLLARRDPATGQIRKIRFGPWIFVVLRILSRLRFLRGGLFDPFGWTAERRTERHLPQEYRNDVENLLECLAPANAADILAFVRIPEMIRGFGHVKEGNLAKARDAREILLAKILSGDDSSAMYDAAE